MEPIDKLILMSLINEPEITMRVSIDDEKLRGLAESIRASGLIHPIAVVADGGRFEIAAGHRRYLACKFLGKDEIRARDYTGTGLSKEQIKAQENLFQEKPDDGAIVVWLGDLKDKYNYTLDQFQQVTGKSENWIAERLSIYAGDRAVFEALLAKHIKLYHAIELNMFPDEYRNMYLQQTILSTPPRRVLQQWRRDVALLVSTPQQPGAPAPVIPAAEMPGIAPVDPCVFCGEAHSSWTITVVRVHQGCLKTVLDALHAGG